MIIGAVVLIDPSPKRPVMDLLQLVGLLTAVFVVLVLGHWVVGRSLGLDLAIRVGPVIGYVREPHLCGPTEPLGHQLSPSDQVKFFVAGPMANLIAAECGPLIRWSSTLVGATAAVTAFVLGLVSLIDTRWWWLTVDLVSFGALTHLTLDARPDRPPATSGAAWFPWLRWGSTITGCLLGLGIHMIR